MRDQTPGNIELDLVDPDGNRIVIAQGKGDQRRLVPLELDGRYALCTGEQVWMPSMLGLTWYTLPNMLGFVLVH